MALNYSQSGVDVEAGDALVNWLQTRATPKQPWSEHIIGGIGGFAAITRLPFSHLQKPCLVTSTDGVGTKVKLCAQFENYAGVGQDLVAMCVNDILTCGAEPFLFLDYFATGKLDLRQAQGFLTGLQAACLASGCALVGGETAEMPGVYSGRDFDCAGFAVGVVDEDAILGSHLVKAGQIVLGVSSNGFHSNGYSLLRKVFEDDLADWKDVLLKPTHLYSSLVKEVRSSVTAMAHITGGGAENIPRVMPPGTRLRLGRWAFPPEFREVMRRAEMSEVEMLKTLNCGVGFALFLTAEKAGEVRAAIARTGLTAFELGVVEESDGVEASIDYGEWS